MYSDGKFDRFMEERFMTPIEKLQLKIELGRAKVFKKDIAIGNTIKLHKKTDEYIDITVILSNWGEDGNKIIRDVSILRGERVPGGIRIVNGGFREIPK